MNAVDPPLVKTSMYRASRKACVVAPIPKRIMSATRAQQPPDGTQQHGSRAPDPYDQPTDAFPPAGGAAPPPVAADSPTVPVGSLPPQRLTVTRVAAARTRELTGAAVRRVQAASRAALRPSSGGDLRLGSTHCSRGGNASLKRVAS